MANVLIVDDDAQQSELLARLLRGEGHQAHCATSAGAALTLLGQAEQDRPDLILMDLRMPRFGGLDALQALKGDPRLANLRVAVYSGMADPDSIETARRLGACDVILKGDDWRHTLRRIQSLLPT